MKRAVRYWKPGKPVMMRKTRGGVNGPGFCRHVLRMRWAKTCTGLGFADGGFAVLLDAAEIVYGGKALVSNDSVRMLAVATASCRAMLMPMPPTGDMAWAASPMQSRPGDAPVARDG